MISFTLQEEPKHPPMFFLNRDQDGDLTIEASFAGHESIIIGWFDQNGKYYKGYLGREEQAYLSSHGFSIKENHIEVGN